MKKGLQIFSYLIIAFILILLIPYLAAARGGGGHGGGGHGGGHSSGGRSSSSHSSSGKSRNSGDSYHFYHSSSSESDENSTEFTVEEPIIVILSIIFVILLLNYYDHKQNNLMIVVKNSTKLLDEDSVNLFKQKDPHFSKIGLLDFVYLLYINYYTHYGQETFAVLKPYFTRSAQKNWHLDQFLQNNQIKISPIIVNSLSIFLLKTNEGKDQIGIEIRAYYATHPITSRYAKQQQNTYYELIERWILSRNETSLSLSPEKLQASLSDQAIQHQSWYVEKRYMIKQDIFDINDLANYIPEKNLTVKSLVATTLSNSIEQFKKRYDCNWSSYWSEFSQNVVHHYFFALNQAWEKGELDTVRHLLSDRLYEAQHFLLNLYHIQKWRNLLTDLQIHEIKLVNVDCDPYYDTITVRIFASCFDYMVDQHDQLIGGSQKKRQHYSEYWTFVRKVNADIHSIMQLGLNAWYLFLITQDEYYTG